MPANEAVSFDFLHRKLSSQHAWVLFILNYLFKQTSMVTLGTEKFSQDITSHSIGSWRGVAVDCDLAFIYTFFSLSHSLISSLQNTIWYKTCPLLIHFDLVWWPNKLWTLFLAWVTGHLALATWLIILIPNLGGSFFWKREGKYFRTCEPI